MPQRPADGSRPPPKVVVTVPPPLPPIRSPMRYEVDGAIIEEAMDSDAGNVLTLDRKEVVKRWVVRCPDIQDKPQKFLKRVFPIGARYPNERELDYQGLLVYGYDEGERVSSAGNVWHSAVIYATLDRLVTMFWVDEGEFTEEQEHITRDESNVFEVVGSVSGGTGNPLDPTYTLAGDTIRVGKIIGHSIYKTDAAGLYVAEAAQGGRINLTRTGAFKAEGIDRYRPVQRFRFTRALFYMTWAMRRSVGLQVCTVNASRFLGFEPGELLFLNFGWRQIYGLFPNTESTTNINYEVVLQFAANPDKWSPIRQYDTWEDEGLVSPVLDGNDNYIVREIHPYRATEFTNIFTTLNVGAPGPL